VYMVALEKVETDVVTGTNHARDRDMTRSFQFHLVVFCSSF
jgi:hypothetical protein